jgi:flagellar motor switch protein FliG
LNSQQPSSDNPDWTLLDPVVTAEGEAVDPLLGWTKEQKLAGFLILMGRDNATTILREFSDREIASIVLEMARLDLIDEAQQAALLQEFQDVAHMAQEGKRGGAEFALEVLEMRLGSYKAREIISRIAPEQGRPVDSEIMKHIDPPQLFHVLRQESTQTQALVLTYLDPSVSAEMLEKYTPTQRVELVERMGLMEPIPTEVVEQLLSKVKERCEMKSGASFTVSGGAKSLAQILGAMNEGSLQQTLADLASRNPALGLKVRQMLFVFDDLAHLDQQTIIEITRTIEMPELALALKPASEEVRQAIYRSFPKRRADYLKDEIEHMPAVRLTEAQAAQQKIVDLIHALQDQGLIRIIKNDKKV